MKINFIKTIENELIPYSLEDKKALDMLAVGAIYEVDIKNMDMRTLKQNRALHLYCKHIAEDLNNKGLYVADVLKIETVWSLNIVKDTIFKPIMKQLYNKTSTTKLKKNEFENIINSITLAFAKKGITIRDFPSRNF